MSENLLEPGLSKSATNRIDLGLVAVVVVRILQACSLRPHPCEVALSQKLAAGAPRVSVMQLFGWLATRQERIGELRAKVINASLAGVDRLHIQKFYCEQSQTFSRTAKPFHLHYCTLHGSASPTPCDVIQKLYSHAHRPYNNVITRDVFHSVFQRWMRAVVHLGRPGPQE